MGLIKFTILVWIIYYVYIYIVINYLKSHPLEALIYTKEGYTPIYKILVALLNLVRFILLISSVVWLLFFR